MQQLEVRLWKEDWQERSEGEPELAFLGQRIPCGQPGEMTVPSPTPGLLLGAGGVGRAAGGRALTKLLKMAAL